MSNIMMTDACNLKCPYCFANEFVNKDRNEISKEAFDKAVDFIVGDGTHKSVGLIGGEPTTHSDFEYFVRKLIKDERVEDIVLYTNGVFLDKFMDTICHPKVKMLINCNSPADIGYAAFERMHENIRTLLSKKLIEKQITLGINMYKPDFEYEYLLDILKEFNCHHVRISITVPNMDEQRNLNPHDYFASMKQQMFKFFHELLSNDIIPNFDCNKIPSCMISKEEYYQFEKYLDSPFIRKNIQKSNITSNEVRCHPVIDIRQDLTAVRCFGLSEWTKENISDFKGIRELEDYYTRTVDAFACNVVYSKKCSECNLYKTLKCTGGCIAYKGDKVKMLQAVSGEMNRKV